MTHPGSCSCPLIPYDEAKALVALVIDAPSWRWRRVEVRQERWAEVWGSCIGRFVRFADVVPWCTVPHELAHVVTGPSHGARFDAALSEITAFARAVEARAAPQLDG